MLGYMGVILTVLVAGVSLGGLVLKLHKDTSRRIDDIANRLVEVEKGQARLEGYLAGLQSHGTQASA